MTGPNKVTVVIGTGGMGLSIARRYAADSHLLLADYSAEQLDRAVQKLQQEGHTAIAVQTDVSDRDSVRKLAQEAAALGPIKTIVHTAGLSPIQAPPERIYQVDLLGTAHVIDAFLPVAIKGTSMVVIASMAGHALPVDLSPEVEKHLATASAEMLLAHPALTTSGDPQLVRAQAYGVSKRGNIVRVQASAAAWGAKGARINSVSPGVIATPMVQQEMDGQSADDIRAIIAKSPAARIGEVADVTNAVAFLTSDDSSFITGSDLLVDGGWIGSQKWK